MKMDESTKRKLLWGLLILTVFNVVVFAGGRLLINKVADKVIQRLQKDYSPSPYGPGFDPDKIKPEPAQFEQFEAKQPQAVRDALWRDDWERSRAK